MTRCGRCVVAEPPPLSFERHVYLAAIEEKLRRLLFLGRVPDTLESWREGGCECTRVGDETFRWCVDRDRGVMRLERDQNVPEWWERREQSAP